MKLQTIKKLDKRQQPAIWGQKLIRVAVRRRGPYFPSLSWPPISPLIYAALSITLFSRLNHLGYLLGKGLEKFGASNILYQKGPQMVSHF